MEEDHVSDTNQRIICQSRVSIDEIHDHIRRGPRQSLINSSVEQKICVLCEQQFNKEDYPDHVVECAGKVDISPPSCLLSMNQYSVYSKSTGNPASDYQSHMDIDEEPETEFATPRAGTPLLIDENSAIESDSLTKDYILCSKPSNESEFEDHSLSYPPKLSPIHHESHMDFDNATTDNNNLFENPEILTYPLQLDENPVIESNNLTAKSSKLCILCNQTIGESEFEDHMFLCLSELPITISIPNESQIDFNVTTDDNIIDARSSLRISDEQDSMADFDSTKECGFCLKPVDESEFAAHISMCLSELEVNENNNKHKRSNSSSSSPRTVKRFFMTSDNFEIESARYFQPIDQFQYDANMLPCFACQTLINSEDKLSKEIPCPSLHIYCLSCLQHSMEEYARNRLVPLCHSTLCNYELSQHDISTIPLERRISDRLMKLAKGQQRPQCPKCHLYIDLNENEDFYEHVESCDILIPCEYCQCPYSTDQIESHSTKCQDDKTSSNEKLVNFIMKRTRYPFTKEQIYFFIQQKKKETYVSLDPLSIIEALAVFGSIFPLEMPTRDCDVCLEARPYDDIYVFDCSDSHKLCYSCYYQSCQTKMSSGEILTCGLCTNPLRDVELNQLRISDEQIKVIQDYQMKKTFDAYSNRTRGIIKCPNQSCTWIAEAEDPNERFKVQCLLCQREFCSLCNQQYHYRTTCQQLPEILQRWLVWCQTERTHYLTMRARQDAVYAARLETYNRELNKNENQNKDLRRRYEELINDEQYKVQNCRLCPSCNRVVQRLEGCDQMICGQDAHGGNVQSGCGKKFNWGQARPYRAAATAQPKQSIIDLPKPDKPIVEHIGVKCDECQNDVHGIRFDCVHCPSLTFCEKCERQSTLNHSRENQLMKQQEHIFRIVMKSE